MLRRRITIAIALATFVVGVEFHLQTMRVAEQIDPDDTIIYYYTLIFEEQKTPASLVTDSLGLPFLDWCEVVVSIDIDRNLYLRKELIGRPGDTKLLRHRIAREFARCDQQLVETQSNDLEVPILTTRWRPGMLYFKSPYPQDITKLVELSKGSGASRIKPIFDRRIKGVTKR